MFLSVFEKGVPSCFFQGDGKKESCTDDILQSFSQCVLESQSGADVLACNKEKENKKRFCQATASKRGAGNGRIQGCNQCLASYDICLE